MQLTLLSAPLLVLAGSDVQALRWTMWLPGLAAPLAALYVWVHDGHLRWRVRRSTTAGR